MAVMTIDVDAIDQLGGDLAGVISEFDNANANSDEISGAVGHTGLSDTVRSFAHKWDDTRLKMTDAIRALSEASVQVAQAWRDADQQGADALKGEGEQSTTSSSPSTN